MTTTQDKHLLQPKYRPDIDGLRALSVLAVVTFHAFPDWMGGGFIGVDVFFVISGYLISTIILEKLDEGKFSFSEFYARRIKRIFPSLIIVLLACFSFGWFALFSDEYRQLGKHIVGGASFLSNFILWREAGYFDNTAETKPLLHLWSLGIEEQFYIFWPFVLWFVWKRKVNVLTIIVALALVSFLLNINGVRRDLVATFYSPQTRLWELLSGSLLSWMHLYKKDIFLIIKNNINNYISINILKKNKIVECDIFANFLSLIGLLLLACGFYLINKSVNFPGMWASIPVLGAVLVITAGPGAWLNRKMLSNKFAVWFGLISFPLYLWHWPLLSFSRIVEGGMPALSIRVTAVGVSILLAWLTYRFIEGPLRFGTNNKATVVLLVLLMTIIGCIGYNLFSRNGYEFRNAIQGIDNKNELVRTPSVDEECIRYIGLKDRLFPYCRYSNVNGTETVAIVGDSHAHVAYPGISEYLATRGINTILLANSSCPPFKGVHTGRTQTEKDACSDRIDQILETVSHNADIKKVFIFTRGTVYTKGTEPITGDKDISGGQIIPIDDFTKAAQLSFDRLSKYGKSIFYIIENPELSFTPQSCLQRPFKYEARNCYVMKNEVLERQADYRNAFKKLNGVTIIDSLSAFCPEKNCLVFDENRSLLYADADHLSVAGSRFQVHRLLRQFLD
jgi:peptidoglycan/LPS O-acetylase OafA/YrhL